ncbi:MAG: homoserine kinase [Alphaproteobacteria bacterium BRH_c36]|nr:MAG: homoserine kinase [Alphaproteobacteria bacterium BRH_c36]
MAVYTEVSNEDLEVFLELYEIGELMSFKGIAEGVENTNYMLHTTTGSFILTLYEKRVETADLPFFLGLMEHLCERGVSCPLPVRDKEGNNLNQLSGRTAALITFLEGFCIKRPQPTHCAELGRALARLHLAGRDFELTRQNALGPAGWPPLFASFATEADTIAAGLRNEIAGEIDWLSANWPQGLPEGVIHADLFPDNVFFIGDKLSGVIDFYFACNDVLSYDIAICLNAWCFEENYSFNATKARALLKAYSEVRPLTQAECAALPVFARGAALRFLLTRCFDWLNTPPSAIVKPHDPLAYLRRLRFHQRVSSIAEYGYDTP